MPKRLVAAGAALLLNLALAIGAQAQVAQRLADVIDGHPHESEPESDSPDAHGAHPPGHAEHGDRMTGPLGISRARMGSGTSWLPDSSPMYALMTGAGDWGFMLHANIFAGYDRFGGRRGDEKLISTNSAMGMAWRPLGPGEIMFRTMLSAEPVTVGPEGYPLILQSGETNEGEPLHDRQHPHDLFMELAVDWTVPLTADLAFETYVAPAGEPALGPTAFPHRVSAMADPLAPIGHHWQDSTHIAYGVATLALFTRAVKFDASWFNGREPDEDRWGIDGRTPDSYAGRVTWNPGESWSLQSSYGYLDSPEALEPDIAVHRVTASAAANYRIGREGNFAATFVFGENASSEGTATPSFLLEATWSAGGRHEMFGRAEYVQKTGHDLVLAERLSETRFSTGQISLGYVFRFGPFESFDPGIGVRGSLGLVEPDLETYYGSTSPAGAMVFLNLRPTAHRTEKHS
ncbi:hypothetical protein K8I61_18355 [bacterium]|nr:hypothetical protein [bacterium]